MQPKTYVGNGLLRGELHGHVWSLEFRPIGPCTQKKKQRPDYACVEIRQNFPNKSCPNAIEETLKVYCTI